MKIHSTFYAFQEVRHDVVPLGDVNELSEDLLSQEPGKFMDPVGENAARRGALCVALHLAKEHGLPRE